MVRRPPPGPSRRRPVHPATAAAAALLVCMLLLYRWAANDLARSGAQAGGVAAAGARGGAISRSMPRTDLLQQQQQAAQGGGSIAGSSMAEQQAAELAARLNQQAALQPDDPLALDLPAGTPQLADAPDVVAFGGPNLTCRVSARVPKVALMFLTTGPMPHELLWSEWLRKAGGLVPRLSLAGDLGFCLSQCDGTGGPPKGRGVGVGGSGRVGGRWRGWRLVGCLAVGLGVALVRARPGAKVLHMKCVLGSAAAGERCQHAALVPQEGGRKGAGLVAQPPPPTHSCCTLPAACLHPLLLLLHPLLLRHPLLLPAPCLPPASAGKCQSRCGASAACNPACLAALAQRYGRGRSSQIAGQQSLYSLYVHAPPDFGGYSNTSLFAGTLIANRVVRGLLRRYCCTCCCLLLLLL